MSTLSSKSGEVFGARAFYVAIVVGAVALLLGAVAGPPAGYVAAQSHAHVAAQSVDGQSAG
ncbi:MAG TPA: hypothetical protein VGG48_04950 [Rhizomicrobium sp.]|jgi:hypothetical protein